MNFIQLVTRLLNLLRFMSLADALLSEKELEGLFNTPIPLRSSCIATVQYNKNSGTLVIVFKDGRSHAYSVPVEKFLELINAPSPGGYYNANIKD